MRIASCSFVALALALPAPAQDAIPLGYGVPDDVHVYVHGVGSETPDPGAVRFERAMTSLLDSGFFEDLFDLATMDLRPGRRRAIEETIERVLAMFGRVDWDLLAEKEIVFAYRLGVPMPEYLVLFRVPEPGIAAQRAAVRAMLEDLGELVGARASVREVQRRSGEMTVFGIEGTPVQVAAGAVGDVLVLSTSTRMLSASMRLLQQGDGEGSLPATERFATSLQALPRATEGVVFVDVGRLLDFTAEALALGRAGMPGPDDDPGRSLLGLLGAFCEELNLVDHLMISTVSDGTTVVMHDRIVMRPGYESSRLAPLFRGQQAWRDWHRLVPADATGFWFDSGVDPVALLDFGTTLVRENWAGAGELLDRGPAARALGEVREVLSCLSGEVAWISLPGDEEVMLLRLAKAEGLAARIGAALESGSQFLASRDQVMRVAEQDGMFRIQLEAFPAMQPVLGVRGDLLVFATSPAALARVDGARGAEGIRDQPRFRQMGVGAGDTVEYLGYMQVDAPLRGFNDFVAAVGFFLSVLPEDEETAAMRKIGALCTKLARALRELDVSYDWATELLPGQQPGVFQGRTVYRYR